MGRMTIPTVCSATPSSVTQNDQGATPESAEAQTTEFKKIARPDKFGRFGRFGGQYVPETLMAALAELESIYTEVRNRYIQEPFWGLQ